MRVLFFVHGHPEFIRGGAEQASLELFEALRERPDVEPILVARTNDPTFARPGTPFGSRNNAFRRGYRRFRLEPGSRVLADVQLPLSTNQLAVLQIEGSAETVLARYAAQLARPGGAPAVKRTALPGGGAILEFGYSPEGGGAAWLRTDRTQRYFTIVYNSD